MVDASLYLRYMELTEPIIVGVHIQAVGEYLGSAKDMDNLRNLMQGENAFFRGGDLGAAVSNFQTIYDAIPASEEIVRQHAHVVLLEAKGCQRKYLQSLN